MRYLITKSKKSEFVSRQGYLYDTFSLYFLKKGMIDDFQVFESFPFVKDDILMIYGHNYLISDFFRKNNKSIDEKSIAIISCCEYKKGDYQLKGKNIYLAPQRGNKNNKGSAYLFSGKDYGFDFDLTEAEIKLFNSREKEILNKIKSVFIRIY